MQERAAWVEVDLSAIAHNVRQFKTLLQPGTKLCAVVKADGYGHGSVAVANASLQAGAEYLAVAMIGEGIELRKAGILAPVLVLGHTPAGQAHLLVEYDLMQSIFSSAAAQALSAAAVAAGKTAGVHLKVDTGKHRIGVRPSDCAALAAEIQGLPGLKLEGVFTPLCQLG